MAFFNYLSLVKGRVLHLNKLECPSPKNSLCQVWLKMDQWFWRRQIFKICQFSFAIFVLSPLRKGRGHSYALHSRMLCSMFGWNLPTGSGEEDFKNVSMYLRHFLIFSPWKRWGPSFGQTWIPFTQGYFVSSFVEIGPVVLEKKKMWKVNNDYNANDNDNGQQTNCDQKAYLSLWLRWAKNSSLKSNKWSKCILEVMKECFIPMFFVV